MRLSLSSIDPAAFVAAIGLAYSLATPSASAIPVEVAKRCQALADNAFPLRVPGNPAAGRINGTSTDFRNYFNKCVANGGNAPDSGPEANKNTPAASQGSGKAGQVPGGTK
jgi:hypothetical protein